MTDVNEFGQPVGDLVPDWKPRDRPVRIGLIGRYVALQPITVVHVPPLHASLCGPDDDALWTYRTTPKPPHGVRARRPGRRVGGAGGEPHLGRGADIDR